jgi:hypothetical protein
LDWITIDGVPTIAPIYDPSTYRGGVIDVGDDVGANPSLLLDAQNKGHVAYQDRSAKRLKYARETSEQNWTLHSIDPQGGEQGDFISLRFDANGHPVVAYNVRHVVSDDGSFVSQLRIAKASSPQPTSENDWDITIVNTESGSCADMCAEGLACVALDDKERCVDASSATCGDTECTENEACVEGVCMARVSPLPYRDIRQGTGVDVTLLGDDADLVTFYDATTNSWSIVRRSQGDWSQEASLEGRGRYSRSLEDDAGQIHSAFQNSRNQLQYVTWNPSSGLSEIWGANLNNSEWSKSAILSDDSLYGFRSKLFTNDRSLWFSTYMIDRSVTPSGQLLIQEK